MSSVAGDPERARDVRAIALIEPPMSSNDRLARLDHALSRLVMRRRRVGAAGDDPERRPCHGPRRPAGRARRVQRPLRFDRPAVRGDRFDHARSAACAASAQQLDLVGVLDRAQRSDRTAEARPKAASGTADWRRSRKVAHSRSDTSRPPSLPHAPPSAPSWISGRLSLCIEQRAATSSNGSSVSSHVTTSTSSCPDGRGRLSGGTLEARHDQRRAAGRRAGPASSDARAP